jgi:hypothetical protein
MRKYLYGRCDSLDKKSIPERTTTNNELLVLDF